MSKRISYEQRQKLLEYMKGHEDLAKNRVLGPDAARLKKSLLEELASELNALGSGATKTPEKWLKCWQDWKSDVKAKCLKIKKAQAGTGGGPSPAPLSPLEENLIQFFGVEMVEGLAGVADPLEVSETVPSTQQPNNAVVPPMQEVAHAPAVQETPPPRRTNDDALHIILERQAAAIENVAMGMQEIAKALQQIAAALQRPS